MPRSLAQFIVRAFNDGRLSYLVCTSTLIEGVNTRAKNVVIWDNSIAKRKLDYFTFNNIKGRSGRMFQHFIGRVYLFDHPPQQLLPFVDFPIFTQDSATPEALLIQLEQADLTESSRGRMEKFVEEKTLSLKTLRANHSVDPARQIELARFIESNANKSWQLLAWRGFPDRYEQFKFACKLIWEFLVDSSRRFGVTSASQLAFKTWQLYFQTSIPARVLAEMRPSSWAAKDANEAVERVLQFDRNWAGFELPKQLRTLSSIQGEVLQRLGLPFGDYSAFAMRCESGFRAPIIAALDEYGIPPEIGSKFLSLLRTSDDLDVGIDALRRLDVNTLKLTNFERELVQNAQQSL